MKSNILNTAETIHARRAVKHFDASHQMPADDEALLFELARQTPSSFNIQHWRIVSVKDKELRSEIRKVSWDQEQITDASLVLLICADIKAWEKNPERYWQDAPEEVRNSLLPMIQQFYEGRDEVQRDEAVRSVGMIAQTLMLAAKSIGYDSCPMIGFEPDKLAKLINLPPDHLIGMIVAIGKAAKPAQSKGGYLPLETIKIEDRF